MWNTTLTRAFACILFTLAAALPFQVRAETPVGSNVDSRVLVGFKANPGGVQQMLPEG